MEAKELRIGNYVNESSYDDCFNTYVVMGLQKRGVSISVLRKKIEGMYDYTSIAPIPLTEEWLLKLGFKDVNEFFYKGGFCVFIDNRSFYYGLRDEGMMDKHLKSVHQLQNLYFALTGEELNIN